MRAALIGLGALLLVVALGLFVKQALLLASAQTTTGHVVSVTSKDGRCGSRRSKHNCTRFSSTIEFTVDGTTHTLQRSAGRTRGHGRPVSDADRQVGDAVAVVHGAGGKPAYAGKGDVWMAPILTLVFGAGAGAGGLVRKRA